MDATPPPGSPDLSPPAPACGPAGTDSDVRWLRLLEAFFIPLTEEDREEQRRVLAEAGTIDCDEIIRRLSGEAA